MKSKLEEARVWLKTLATPVTSSTTATTTTTTAPVLVSQPIHEEVQSNPPQTAPVHSEESEQGLSARSQYGGPLEDLDAPFWMWNDPTDFRLSRFAN